jgi:hypothetical protein
MFQMRRGTVVLLGSGALRGERNGNFRTGRYTEETQAMLRAARLLMRGARRIAQPS